MSCHSVLETSSLKEAYDEKRDRKKRTMAIRNPSAARASPEPFHGGPVMIE